LETFILQLIRENTWKENSLKLTKYNLYF